jgi:hypothetical protein
MKDKEALFKKFVNNPYYTNAILRVINYHDFSKQPLKYTIEDITFELHQVGNDIKVRK